MEKPVRVLENTKIRDFNEKVRGGLEHALNFMLPGLEAKIQISYFEPFLMPMEAYLQAYRKQSVMIKIHSERAYQGELYWFFELRTAILLGSLMRMMTPQAVEEKLAKGDFDAMDQDAFGEVGNQLCGILDRAFRTLTKRDIHLRMDFEKKVFPHESIKIESFRNQEEYVVFLSTITVPKQGGQKITLLLPRSLYEVMLNLDLSLEGITPKKVVLYSHQEEKREAMQAQMISRYTKVLPATAPDEVLTLVDEPGVSAVGIELPRMDFPLQHQDKILLKRFASNQTLKRMPYFLTWDGADGAQVAEVQALGLSGAVAQAFAGFPGWAQGILKDPSRS